MALAGKGDFLVVEAAGNPNVPLLVGRPELDPKYRVIVMAGSTLDKEGLLGMADGMRRARQGLPVAGDDQRGALDIDEAISVIEGGGWTVLRFLN